MDPCHDHKLRDAFKLFQKVVKKTCESPWKSMVGRWSFPFWGWRLPILKVSLHVFPAFPPSKKNGSAKVKLRFCAWWSCICPLGRPGFGENFQPEIRQGSTHQIEEKVGWNPMILQGFWMHHPNGGSLFGISEPSTVWCRYDEVLNFCLPEKVELKEKWWRGPRSRFLIFFSYRSSSLMMCRCFQKLGGPKTDRWRMQWRSFGRNWHQVNWSWWSCNLTSFSVTALRAIEMNCLELLEMTENIRNRILNCEKHCLLWDIFSSGTSALLHSQWISNVVFLLTFLTRWHIFLETIVKPSYAFILLDLTGDKYWDTVDGRNPAPPEACETLWIMG